jgi:alkylhydroperoxidase family enzyme
MRLRTPRIAALADSDMSPEAAQLFAPLAANKFDFNVFRTMLNNPVATQAFLEWGNYILSKKNSLPPREREIAILRAGFNCGAGYEWAQHVVIGKRVGLTDAEIAAIKTGADAPGWSAADAALLAATDDLARDHCVSDASWARLKAHFTDIQCMDLVYTVGQYTLVSMLLNSFGVQLDDGLVLDPDLDHRG